MDKHFLDLFGLSKYFQKMKEYVQAQVNTRVPTTRTVNGKALSSDITLTAANVSARPSSWTPTAAEVGALPITGGTLTGNLTIKGSSSYGTKINLGDGDYVHFSEPTDDCLEIKAKKVNFVLSDSTDTKFTINGASPFAAASGGSDVEVVTWVGTSSDSQGMNSFYYAHSGSPTNGIIMGNYDGVSYSRSDTKYIQFVFNGGTKANVCSFTTSSGGSISSDTCTVTLDTSSKSVSVNYSKLGITGMKFSAVLFFE